MRPEAQRIAIVEACGWIPKDSGWITTCNDGKIRGWSLAKSPSGKWRFPPDYLSDLNAAIELCDFLSKSGWHCEIANGLDTTWECEFWRPATKDTHPDDIGTKRGETGDMEIHYASADKLATAICEAFLRTLNLWVEGEQGSGAHAQQTPSDTRR